MTGGPSDGHSFGSARQGISLNSAVSNQDPLDAIALQLADGAPIDWATHELVLPEAERRYLARLRQLEALALVHAGGDHDPSGVHDSIRSGAGDASGGAPVRWGPLTILDKIGRGSYGDVYRARDTRLGRDVALKLLRRREHSTDEENALVHEGHLLSRVRHPNVVTVYGAERIDGRTGLWMEFIQGETLEDELHRRGPLPAADVVDIGVTLCSAIAAVHAAGLLHRDVKLQNVMRDGDGRLVLMDFGAGDEAAGGEGRLAGTPLYLTPEVLNGAPPDVSSDLYALGVALFRLATARYPTEARTLSGIRAAHRDGAIQTVSSIRPDLPRPLAAAIDRAIAPAATERFATPIEMREAIAAGSPRAPGGRRRRRTAVAVAALAVALGTGLGWVAWHGGIFPTTRGARAVPFEARDWALVAAFDNATGDPLLDGTAEHALAHELSNSTFVNVVPRIRIDDALQLMEKPVTARVDEAVAREVALRDGGIRVIVAGRLARVGSRYDVSARILRPSDAAVLGSLSETARDQPGLLPAIQRLALNVRDALGEQLPAAERSSALQRVTTPSLRALQLYSEAVDGMVEESPRPREAVVQLLRDALSLDPNFAMARVRLASITPGIPPEERIATVERVAANSARMSEAERVFVNARLHALTWQYAQGADARLHLERAVAAYEALARVRPDDYAVLQTLARLYRQAERPAEARALHRRMATARPASVISNQQVAVDLLESGDVEAARAQVGRIRALNAPLEQMPNGVAAWLALFDAHYAWLRNDPREALAVTERVAEQSRQLPLRLRNHFETHVTFMYLTLGCLDRAEQFASASSTINAIGPEWRLTTVVAQRNDVPALRRFLNSRLRDPQVASLLVSYFLDAGLVARARELMGGSPPGLYRSQLALAEGRMAEAIRLLEAERRRHAADRAVTGPRIDRKLAEALVAAGRRNEAIAVLEEASRARSRTAANVSSGFDWLRVRAQLSKLYRDSARHQEADAIDAELRLLLAVADDDHPLKRSLPRERAPFAPRDFVLVARFDNRTGESVLDGALEYALERQLLDSTIVGLVPIQRVHDALQLMKQPLDTIVTPAVGREIALRDGGIKLVLGGRIDRVGATYTLTAQLMDPVDGAIVAQHIEQRQGTASLPSAIAAIARRVRTGLGERLPQTRTTPPGQPATTHSLRAFQLYNQAYALGRERQWPASLAIAREVVREDPTFGSGWIWLAWSLANTRAPVEEVRAAADRARSLIDGAPEWERLWIVGSHQFLHGDHASSVATYQALLRLRPDHYYGANNLMYALLRLNQRGQLSDVFADVANLRPLDPSANVRAAAWVLAAKRDIAAARPFVERARSTIAASDRRLDDSFESLWIGLFDVYTHWVRRDIVQAADQLDALTDRFSKSRSVGRLLLFLSSFYAALGRIERADAVLATIPDSYFREYHRLTILAMRGDTAGYRESLRQLEGDSRFREKNHPRHYLAAGLVGEARRIVATFSPSPGDPLTSLMVDVGRGQLQLLDGKPADAAASFAAVLSGLRDPSNLREYHTACQGIATAFSQLSRHGDAVRELQRCADDQPYLLENGWFGPQAWMTTRYQLAAEYRALGRIADARAIEADLRKLLAVADDDHPLKRSLGPAAPAAGTPAVSTATIAALHPKLRYTAHLRAASADPRLVTCTPWGRSAVAVCDVETGEIRIVRAMSDPVAERSSAAHLSPDGRRVAYLWATGPVARPTSTSIRLINVDGTGDRELQRTAGVEDELAVLGWARDGRAVLIGRTSGGTARLTLFPLDGGSATVVYEAGGRIPYWASLSPDGRYLAITPRPGLSMSEDRLEVYVRDLRSRTDHPVIGAGWSEYAPLWTPAGDILFMSRRVAIFAVADDGRRGLHVIDVATGAEQRLADTPPFADFRWITADHILLTSVRGIERLDVRTGTIESVSTATAGSRVAKIAVSRDGSSLATLEVASSTGCTLRAGPAGGPMTDRHVFSKGWCDAVAWSHDGSRILVAVAEPIPIPHPRPSSLWFVSRDGGTPVRLPVPGEPIVGMSISPDGREVLFTAGNPRPEAHRFSGFLPPK